MLAQLLMIIVAATAVASEGDITTHTVEAEVCKTTGPFRIAKDKDEPGRSYLHLPPDATPAGPGPTIQHAFSVERKGLYEVKLRVRTAKRSASPFAVAVDGRRVTWDLRRADRWSWRAVPELFRLSPGRHTLRIRPACDGVNCDSSRNVIVESCYFHTSDDAVAIKSGLNEDGWRVDRPSEKIIIRHCRSSGGKWGGISFGSDMSGDVRNVLIHDVHFADTSRAINFKSTRGRGGTVENVFVRDILVDGNGNEPFRADTHYRAWFGSDAGKPPTIRNLRVRDLVARDVRRVLHIHGLPERPIQDIVLENVTIEAADEPAHIANVKGLRMEDVSIRMRRR